MEVWIFTIPLTAESLWSFHLSDLSTLSLHKFISYPAYLTYAEYIMRNAGLDEAQAQSIKIDSREKNQ